MTGEEPQGWYEDPFRRHDARYFSAGRPTRLVRDGNVESYDEPPGEGQPGSGVIRTLERAEGKDPSPSGDEMPADMPRRSRAGLVMIATMIAVAGAATAAVLARKPAPVTVPMSPTAFVNQSVRRTLSARTADMTLSGSVSELGKRFPLNGAGQINFGTNAMALSLTFRSLGYSVVEEDIQTEKNLYIALRVDGRSTGKWLESPVRQSDIANPVSWLLALAQHGHTVQPLGRRVIDGVPCTGYSITPVGRGMITTVGYDTGTPRLTVTVWFDARGLLRQMSGSSDDHSTTDMVLSFSDHGTQVRISAPPSSDTTSAGWLSAGRAAGGGQGRDESMSIVPVLDTLETDRLILRHRRVDEAAIYRQLWTERDPRVPPHRRVGPEGRPATEDIAATIRGEREPGLLAVERKVTADVIGYCGLIFHGNGPPDEPELAYELLRAAHGRGYATEAGLAVVTWAGEAGYRRLWAGVRDWNVASRRVLEKLGFRETGQVERDAVHGDSLLTVREF